MNIVGTGATFGESSTRLRALKRMLRASDNIRTEPGLLGSREHNLPVYTPLPEAWRSSDNEGNVTDTHYGDCPGRIGVLVANLTCRLSDVPPTETLLAQAMGRS